MREFSLVSEGATISNLFEAIQNGADKDVEEFINAVKGNEDVDYQGLQEFLADVRKNTRGQRDIICSEVKELSGAKKLSRKEVIDGVEEFFGSGTGRKLTKDEQDLISDVFGV